MDLPDDGRCVLSPCAALLQRLDVGGLVDPVWVGTLDAQWPVDRHLPVAKRRVVEDLALLGLLEGEERIADAVDVLFAELAVLLP